MAALVITALAQVGDKPAWLAAVLADRHSAPGAVIAGAVLALAGVSALAAVGGALLSPRMTPEAKTLLLACALLLQGAGAWWRGKGPDRLEGWRTPVLLTSFFGIAILLFGEGVQFVVLALAARSSAPALAALGATLGGGAVIAAASMLGERAWLRLRLLMVKRAVGGVFVLAALWIGLGAVKLV